jgi:hypothetical protein
MVFGSGKYISVPISAPGAQVSIEALIYLDALPSYPIITCTDNANGSATYDRQLGVDSTGQPYFYCYDGTPQTIRAAVAQPAN